VTSQTTAQLIEEFPSAAPFDFPGGPEAVLFVHGFTGTPAEMRPVAEMIHAKFGFRCIAPLLPGHGTYYKDIEKFKAEDWMTEVDEKFHALSKEYKRIHLVGLSMGALLCLELYKRTMNENRIKSMVLMAPPVFLKTWPQRFLSSMARYPFIYLWVPPVDKETKDLPEHIAYDKYTARASGEFARTYLRAQTLTPISSPPTLIITSNTDEVVHNKSGQFIYDRLQNPKNKYIQLKQSTHVITLGEAKKDVMNEIDTFYKTL